MKNPYEHDWLEDEVRVGRAGLRLGLAAFLLFLLAPAASLRFPSLRPDAAEPAPTLKARLAVWEERAKTVPLLNSWRRADQARFARILGAGNRRVITGRGGWLYYRPDLEAVFGKGPHHVEPPSVARERHDRAWQPPLPVIGEFANRLAQRGIRLVFVPVPTKAMVCREGLGLNDGTAVPPAWPILATDLASAGIEFVDLVPLIARRGADETRYLKQDTHWTPQTMEAAAREVAARVANGSGPVSYPVETLERTSRGDLVGMLDLGDAGESLFPAEQVVLRRPVPPGRDSDDAEVVLLGDSFVNIFEDPELGFGTEGEESIGAGFASHLAGALGKPVHPIAINGGGATAVREAFAVLPPERLARVETVVWVVSARDVLLPELPARRSGIEWRTVTFPAAEAGAPPPAAGVRDVVATLREKSVIENPKLTPYAEAIRSTLFETGAGEELYVFHWAFRRRELEPAAALETGRRYRLRLVPLEQAPAAAVRATRLDDLFRTDLAPWFAEAVEAE